MVSDNLDGIFPHWLPCQCGSTQRQEKEGFSNHRLWWEPGKKVKGVTQRMSDDDIDVTKHQGDAIPQLLTCHTLICIRLRLCLQAPRSCQAAVRKRAAGSHSCGWGGQGGVGWESESSNNGVMKEECWDKRWVEHETGERGRVRKGKKERGNETTKLYLDKELGWPSQTPFNLQRLN